MHSSQWHGVPSPTWTGYCHGGGSEDFMSHGRRSSHTALGWHSPRRPSMPASKDYNKDNVVKRPPITHSLGVAHPTQALSACIKGVQFAHHRQKACKSTWRQPASWWQPELGSEGLPGMQQCSCSMRTDALPQHCSVEGL
eukprot:scaffold122689_cov17-Tisochrysis_lutea.AAC.1